MFRKFQSIAALTVCVIIFAAVSPALAGVETKVVYNAKDLQKALDDGIANIRIGSSITGNFIVPRWVYSISGTNQNVTLTPLDESKLFSL